MIKGEAANKVNMPPQDKVVAKEVPAVIHWGQVENFERNDSEEIGTAIIYEDGTSDVILKPQDEMSEDARHLLYSFQMGQYSIAEEDADGPSEQE